MGLDSGTVDLCGTKYEMCSISNTRLDNDCLVTVFHLSECEEEGVGVVFCTTTTTLNVTDNDRTEVKAIKMPTWGSRL